MSSPESTQSPSSSGKGSGTHSDRIERTREVNKDGVVSKTRETNRSFDHRNVGKDAIGNRSSVSSSERSERKTTLIKEVASEIEARIESKLIEMQNRFEQYQQKIWQTCEEAMSKIDQRISQGMNEQIEQFQKRMSDDWIQTFENDAQKMTVTVRERMEKERKQMEKETIEDLDRWFKFLEERQSQLRSTLLETERNLKFQHETILEQTQNALRANVIPRKEEREGTPSPNPKENADSAREGKKDRKQDTSLSIEAREQKEASNDRSSVKALEGEIADHPSDIAEKRMMCCLERIFATICQKALKWDPRSETFPIQEGESNKTKTEDKPFHLGPIQIEASPFLPSTKSLHSFTAKILSHQKRCIRFKR